MPVPFLMCLERIELLAESGGVLVARTEATQLM